MQDYSEEVREMLIRGTKISAIDHIHAKRVINEELKKEFLAILQKKVDVIVVPTTIISAPRSNFRNKKRSKEFPQIFFKCPRIFFSF